MAQLVTLDRRGEHSLHVVHLGLRICDLGFRIYKPTRFWGSGFQLRVILEGRSGHLAHRQPLKGFRVQGFRVYVLVPTLEMTPLCFSAAAHSSSESEFTKSRQRPTADTI